MFLKIEWDSTERSKYKLPELMYINLTIIDSIAWFAPDKIELRYVEDGVYTLTPDRVKNFQEVVTKLQAFLSN